MSTQAMGDALSELCQQVQYNCSISDAIYAREFTLCIYLLRMREFYRWQYRVPFGKHLSLDDVGDWVSKTEQYWDEIEEHPFAPIQIGASSCDPFDSVSINALLAQNESDYSAPLIYSAGIGRRGQPHFLLAEGERLRGEGNAYLYSPQHELARDINSPVAMTRDGLIVVSRAGLRRMLWELYEEWSFKRKDGPMARLSRSYGWLDDFDQTDGLDQATEDLIDVLIAHEYGEIAAADYLPEHWTVMMEAVVATNASAPTALSISNELYMRAVRDNLADSLRTWPLLLGGLESNEPAGLDFWLASLGSIRRQMLERSEFNAVLSARSDDARLAAFAEVIATQLQHWQKLACTMTELYQREGDNSDLATVIAA